MDKKESFILFHDHLDSVLPELTMEQRGMLLTALNDHSHDRTYTPEFDDPRLSGLRIAYNIMAGALDTNAEKYEQRCRTNAANRAKAKRNNDDYAKAVMTDDSPEGSLTIVDNCQGSGCDTGTDTGTETVTDNGTGAGTGISMTSPTTVPFKYYGLYHNVRLTDKQFAEIMARVVNPQERIDKYSTGINKGWRGYDIGSDDHYDRILQFAEKDGMLRGEQLRVPDPSPPLTINEEDRRRVIDLIDKTFGDKGLVREAEAVYKIRTDNNAPSSPGVIEKIQRYAKAQSQYT